jgi:hypothetical protein
MDAQCVIYNGPVITCNDNVIVAPGTNLADALNAIVAAFCVAP